MKIYLVENRKNSAKERMTIKFFPDNYVKFVHLLKDERALFNKEVFNEIAENLAKKEVDGSDIALSIEGAFFKNRCGFFLADVCGVKDKHGVRFGMGYFYEISENMYNAVKAGKNQYGQTSKFIPPFQIKNLKSYRKNMQHRFMYSQELQLNR